MNTKDINGPAPGEQSGHKNAQAADTGKETENNREQGNPENNRTESGEKPVKDQNGPGIEADKPESGTGSGHTGKQEPGPAGETSAGEEAIPEKEQEAETKEPLSETGDTGKQEPGPAEETSAGEEAIPEKEQEAETKEPLSETGHTGKQEPGPAPDGTLEPASDTDRPDDTSGKDEAIAGSLKYQELDKEQLLTALEQLLDSRTVAGMREEVEAIKSSFYKTHKAEIEQRRKKFMQEGGDAEAFDPGSDPQEERFKELYRKYRHSKAAHNRNLDSTRQSNYEEKLKVIEDLKELAGSADDINRSFSEFRKLQKRWHEIGIVPQQNLKDMWDTYHYYVEMFYDQVKIDKELRDLDLRKNLEAKIELCEKAEELLLEPNIIDAFRKLQKIHDQWRETGPVPRDQKDVIWERLREVTHQINKKHQEHFDRLKETQKNNLETKIALCEKAETINETPFENLQQVEKLTRDMVNLQKIWKTIGFAPRKDNARIYNRFRTVTDRFFARKREFASQNKEFLSENLQKKVDLCIQAEALKESTDWKRTTDELIALQKKWKEIGPVPRKHYDPVWKRFRAACDHFFDRKSEYFSGIDARYEENLKKKLELIEKIENFKFGSDLDASLNTLKEYQRQWVSIGFVPIRDKESVQKKYRAALDRHFEGLKVDENRKNLMKFRHKLEGVRQKPRAMNKMKFEREKFLNRYKQLESDITLWENNIGFFAKSRSAEATIREFREKIEQGKKQLALLEEKIRMIDEIDPD
jgi:hypothetical protein